MAGELDGVTEQVDQDLTQPGDVPDDTGRAAYVDLAGELEAFGVRRGRNKLKRVLDAAAQIEGLLLQPQAAGLYLREVENH